MREILRDIRTKPVVPVWPHVGMILDMSRNGVYAAVARNEIPEVFRVGRLLKAASAPLRKRLGLDEAAPERDGAEAA
jgi:hypothetical protein